MIYRITVVTKMKDVVKSEIEKHFKEYTCQIVDTYKNGAKNNALVFEIDGQNIGESVESIASAIMKSINVKAKIHGIATL